MKEEYKKYSTSITIMLNMINNMTNFDNPTASIEEPIAIQKMIEAIMETSSNFIRQHCPPKLDQKRDRSSADLHENQLAPFVAAIDTKIQELTNKVAKIQTFLTEKTTTKSDLKPLAKEQSLPKESTQIVNDIKTEFRSFAISSKKKFKTRLLLTTKTQNLSSKIQPSKD